MQSSYTLRTETWAAGGTRYIPLTGLTPGMRTRALRLYFDLSGTKDAADALTADNFARSIQRIQIGEYVSITGESLYELNKELFGRDETDASTDIPASGTTFDMEFALTIPFRDPRQTGSDDGSMPNELLDTLSIQITFAASTFAGVGNLTVTAGSAYAQAEQVLETAIPQINKLSDFQPGSLTFQLEPGVYKSLFLLDGGANVNGSITVAEVTTVDVQCDALPVWTSARHESVISAYNSDVAADAAGGVAINSASRFPLIWQDRFGKAHITKQPAIEKGGTVRISAGTLTAGTMTVVSWRALPKSEEAIKQIAEVIGEVESARDTGGHSYLPSTSTKTALGSAKKTAARGLSRPKRKARLGGLVMAGHFRKNDEI